MKRLMLAGVTLAIVFESSQVALAVPVPELPDGGSTMGLLALSIFGIGVLARKLRRSK